MRGRSDRSPLRLGKFLEALAAGHSVTRAAQVIGSARRTIYSWRETSAVFAQSWDAAIEEGTDRLEDEARRRAVDGTDRPEFFQGAAVGTVREYSDFLLAMLLKGRRKDKYSNRVEERVTGTVRIIETMSYANVEADE